jgi:hypothetical protein
MSQTMNIFIGRDNREVYLLLQDGDTVPAFTATRAVLVFGSTVLDTVVDTDELKLIEDGTKLQVQAGSYTGLTAGTYDGKLTVFDLLSWDDGIAWERFSVSVKDWATPGIVVAVAQTGIAQDEDIGVPVVANVP